jgi:hypothetical protein
MKIKVHKASERLPKLLPINEKKRRFQPASKRCMVWWKWKEVKNDSTRSFSVPDEVKFAKLYKGNIWQIEGITGGVEVIAWCYVPLLTDEILNP